MSDDPGLLEEHRIRRALRLDAEEMPARLDPALIAAAARLEHSRVSTTAAVGVAIAFVGGWIWAEVFRALAGLVLANTAFDPLGALISLASGALVVLARIAAAASAPAVPIAILVVAAIALLFEQMKGRTHATPS